MTGLVTRNYDDDDDDERQAGKGEIHPGCLGGEYFLMVTIGF
jgi:hypothetical protein